MRPSGFFPHDVHLDALERHPEQPEDDADLVAVAGRQVVVES